MSNFHFLFCLELIFTPPASPESLPARWPAAICYCSFQNITISSCFGLWMVCSVQGCFCSQDNSPTFPTRVVRLSLVVGDTSVCSRSRRLLSLEITATLNPASIQRSETLNSQRWFRKGHDNEQKCVHCPRPLRCLSMSEHHMVSDRHIEQGKNAFKFLLILKIPLQLTRR